MTEDVRFLTIEDIIENYPLTPIRGQQWIGAKPESEADQPTATRMAADQWQPYEGPRGGKGWKNTETGDVVDGDKPTGREGGDE